MRIPHSTQPLILLLLRVSALSLSVLMVNAQSGASSTPSATFPSLTSTAPSSGATGSSSSSISATGTNSTLSASVTSTAQYPSLSGYSSCVSTCLATGISRVNCTSIVDVNCFCQKPNFTSELTSCILAICPTEVTTAENLAQQFCNVASGSPSLSFPPIPSTSQPPSSSSSSTSTSASVTPTATLTGGTGRSFGLGWIGKGGVLAGMGVTLLGGMLGACFVL